MRQRRAIVFLVIILAGAFLGIYILPGGDDPDAAEDGEPSEARVATPGPGDLEPAALGRTPQQRAQALFERAEATSDPRRKAELLVRAHREHPTSPWGGEAAAVLGHMWREAGEPAKARSYYEKALRAPVSPATLREVNAQLDRMAPRPGAAPAATGQIKTVRYKVQKGDSLWRIAKRFNTTIGAIKDANRLSSSTIRVDARLRVPQGPFHVVVHKRTHTLALMQGDQVVKVYAVGLGRPETPTPSGTFTIQNKLVNPVWYSPDGAIQPGDPRNVLGSRWMAFDGRIGIHGTRRQDEKTIGTDSSNGCVRMRDADVRELYKYLVPQKSKVVVKD
jgi:lipoprotein-anchoring transpeptidase ErfK/SrfK